MERETTATIDRLQLSNPGENLKVRGKERELTVSLLFNLIKTEIETSVSLPNYSPVTRRKSLRGAGGGECVRL
jgi:hypothetical protein